MNNDEKILEAVKAKIAISNCIEEEKGSMNNMKKSIVKIAAVVCLTIISVTGVVFAKDIENFIRNLFGANTSDGVDIAINNGYVSDVKTEAQSAEGIDIQVDSLVMDDFNFAMNFNMILDEKYNIDEFETTYFEDLRIVDEQGNIVFSTDYDNHKNEGTSDWEPEYWGGYSFLAEKINDRQFKVSLSATGNPNLFPKSKHLNVKFTKINTMIYNEIENRPYDKFYEGNWNFEVDVPQEFYNRETVFYKAKSCNDKAINIDTIEAVLSNTAFRISIPVITTDKVDTELVHKRDTKNIYDTRALQKEYVETSDGKKFETTQRSDGDGGYSIDEQGRIVNYYQTFNLTKYDATNEISIHIFTNKKEEIIIKLERGKLL